MPIQIQGVPKGYYPIPKIPKNKYYMQGNYMWNGNVWIHRLAAYGWFRVGLHAAYEKI